MRELNGADATPYPEPADLLRALRARHVISAVRSGTGWIDAHCGVRVIPRSSGARPLLFRHDARHVQDLLSMAEPAAAALCSNWLRCRHAQCVNARARAVARTGSASGPSGLEAYRMVAEELSDPATSLRDLDAEVVAKALAYATRAHAKWPPAGRITGPTFRVLRISGPEVRS